LQHWIQNGLEMIRTTTGIFQWVRQSLIRRDRPVLIKAGALTI
jgi:hypothetical protein